MSTYYRNELNKVIGNATSIKIAGEAGTETRWLNLNADSRAALIEWLNKQPLTLFEKVVNRGIEWDNHCSDLYIPVNDKTRELINDYEFKCNVTTFKSAIDGSEWYDIPFSYPGE